MNGKINFYDRGSLKKRKRTWCEDGRQDGSLTSNERMVATAKTNDPAALRRTGE